MQEVDANTESGLTMAVLCRVVLCIEFQAEFGHGRG